MGDIVRVENKQFFPADLLFLSSRYIHHSYVSVRDYTVTYENSLPVSETILHAVKLVNLAHVMFYVRGTHKCRVKLLAYHFPEHISTVCICVVHAYDCQLLTNLHIISHTTTKPTYL